MKKGVIVPIHLLLLLNILTCGLFCWIYKTIISIKDFTGKEDINPLIEVLLGFFTCGLYFKFSTQDIVFFPLLLLTGTRYFDIM